MANLPSFIQLPASVPTSDPAIAGYLAQLSIGLNQWITMAATAINESQATLKIGNWTIQEDGVGGLVLTFGLAPGGSWTIPNPNGNTFTVGAAP